MCWAAVVSRWEVVAWSGSSALSLVLGGVRLGFWGRGIGVIGDICGG